MSQAQLDYHEVVMNGTDNEIVSYKRGEMRQHALALFATERASLQPTHPKQKPPQTRKPTSTTPTQTDLIKFQFQYLSMQINHQRGTTPHY